MSSDEEEETSGETSKWCLGCWFGGEESVSYSDVFGGFGGQLR